MLSLVLPLGPSELEPPSACNAGTFRALVVPVPPASLAAVCASRSMAIGAMDGSAVGALELVPYYDGGDEELLHSALGLHVECANHRASS